MRNLAAAISGYALWTVLWLTGNAALRGMDVLPADRSQAILNTGPLLMVLWLGTICSVLAGCVASLICRPPSRTGVVVLGILLFASGCYFELSGWNLTPVWYHCVFLVMLVPATLAGGRIVKRPDPGPAMGAP
jgi:hypothetical protein